MSENTMTALALVPRGLEEAERMATKLSESSMLPDHFRGKPANVFWALAYGLEVGLTPVQSLQSLYVVHGRPGMYADAMIALVLVSGKAEYFHRVESSATEATYETKRKGSPKAATLTVTIDDAKAAGWTSNAKYTSEPRRMLEARCKSQLARDCYPDVLRGMAAAEDIEADGPGGPQFTAPPPSKGDIIEITEGEAARLIRSVKLKPAPAPAAAQPPAKQEVTAQPEEPPDQEDDLRADGMDILRGIHESTSVSDLEAQLDPMRELFGKLGKGSDMEKEVREQYKAKKAQLKKAGAA
jgi:hypothetical protein